MRFLNIVPRSILEDETASVSLLIKARMLGFALANLTVICVLFSLTFTVLHLATETNYLSSIIAGYSSLAVALMLDAFFWKSGRVAIVSILLSTLFVVACLICVGISGGARSPLLPILVASPVLATVTGGRSEGLYYGFFTLLVGAIFIFLDEFGFDMTAILPVSNYNIQFAATWVITVVLVSSLVIVHQSVVKEYLPQQ